MIYGLIFLSLISISLNVIMLKVALNINIKIDDILTEVKKIGQFYEG